MKLTIMGNEYVIGYRFSTHVTFFDYRNDQPVLEQDLDLRYFRMNELLIQLSDTFTILFDFSVYYQNVYLQSITLSNKHRYDNIFAKCSKLSEIVNCCVEAVNVFKSTLSNEFNCKLDKEYCDEIAKYITHYFYTLSQQNNLNKEEQKNETI